MTRDHGGNLDWAIRHFGGAAAEWIDLSTGINRVPYPVPDLPASAWTDLPTGEAKARLLAAAALAYGSTAPMLALPGAQAAIQLMPHLAAPGRARVLAPTYNEHAGALRAMGWQVEEVAQLDALSGADLAVVVNPNNPDGRQFAPDDLMALLPKVGRLVVDESFADAAPALSLAAQAGVPGLLILRSFGKFYGLAGLRLGFVLGSRDDIAALTALAGPWPVSGMAIEVACRALADRDWAATTVDRLRSDVQRADTIAEKAGWQLVGGTALFRLYQVPKARAAQDRLARAQIWSRIFPYSSTWIRLGLPGSEAEFARLEAALAGE